MERPVRAALIGALAGALATLPGLGSGTLWDNSETAYGEVAREVLLTHDWIVLHFNGHPWFVQPPLYFWIAALAARVFGITAFALRLPSALATVAMGAVLAYALARRCGERAGIVASIVLSTALMQAVIGRLAIMDAILDLAVTVAVLSWFRALETGRERYYVYGAVATAFGFLAKGPVAPVVALLVVVPYVLWAHRDGLRLPSLRACVIASFLFLLIVVPWFAATASRTGMRGILQLLGHYTVGRYTGVIENQSGPFWYYLPVLILGFFPWIAFLPPAIFYGASRTKDERLWKLGFTWIVVPLVFFSFARTKLPNYVALELPGLAIVTALYFDAVARKGATRSAIIASTIVPVTIGLLAIAIRVFTLENRLTVAVAAAVAPLLGAAIAVFAGSLVTAVLLARRFSIGAAPYALGLAMLAAVDVLAVAVLPHAEAFKPVPALAAIIDRDRRSGDAVAIQDVSGSNALIFYTRPGVIVLSSPSDASRNVDDPRRVICDSSRLWLVAPRAQPTIDPTYGRSRRVIATAAKAALELYSGATCSPASR